MMIDPASAWGTVGVEVEPDPLVQALYGGAIMGEGIMFALCAVWPVRYLVFFQYLVIYSFSLGPVANGGELVWDAVTAP
jgi:hypothetical protein